jgi:hypothetical protein
MKEIKLSIPKTCQEDWNKMTNNSNGKFCSLCNKNVINFTEMSDEELKNYFLHYQGASVCGRLRKEQIDMSPNLKRNKIQRYFINLHSQYSSIKPSFYKLLLVAFLNLALVLFGCKDNGNKHNEIHGELVPIDISDDTIPIKIDEKSPNF